MNRPAIARHRDSDQSEQPLVQHLQETARLCADSAQKIDAKEAGRLLGLLHDFGKYSTEFQEYLTNKQKGEQIVDHSTAGAQLLWRNLNGYGKESCLISQMLALCLVSHHGGLIDCLSPDGSENSFQKRISKEDAKTHLQECLAQADKEIAEALPWPDEAAAQRFLRSFWPCIAPAIKIKEPARLRQFRLGMITRFLWSCLIDADRISSADFAYPANVKLRRSGPVDWQTAIERLEAKTFPAGNDSVNAIRQAVSEQCRKRAEDPQGIYTLTVPTGGGKTFASMRYALHHAKAHQLDRIIYIIPFTSIIEQNADEIRKVIEQPDDERPWVLEHHSSLEPEKRSQRMELATENWDAPIIFTTMVQFLEALFGGGTRSGRRMHNLAKAVLIFDEIQSLPVKCAHLFCNAVQFLADQAGSTAVLCTATQPVLHELRCPDKGQLVLAENHRLIDPSLTPPLLNRVRIKNQVRPQGWTAGELADLALQQLADKGNCLVVVNTKTWARNLYERCAGQTEYAAHLSTNLCPAHRKTILDAVKERLAARQPVLCISTQLIEAGVDVDFNAVIRFLAGLDSIAQAAGRCNRNGKLEQAEVLIVNPQTENISQLEDMMEGRNISRRIFAETAEADLLQPDVMTRYFKYYFHNRAGIMSYPLTAQQAKRRDTLLNLLSDNPLNGRHEKGAVMLQQSFKAAGKAFAAIDAPTQAVLVPYEEGKNIISELCAADDANRTWKLLRQAQQYSVNVFPHVWQKLLDCGAVRPVREDEDIYFLDEHYYSPEFGLSVEAKA